jgi:protein SCO1/2
MKTFVVLAVALACSVSCTQPGRAAAPRPSGPSIYDLDLPLVESTGQPLNLADLRGRPMVAAMLYTSCTTVCPRITEDMKGIERALPPGQRDAVTFAVFSLDPERDTPAVLRRFAGEHQLDRSRWRLFAASADNVRTLAAALGVQYARQTSGEIAHSAMIFVIDPDGTVRHRKTGLAVDSNAVSEAVAASLSAAATGASLRWASR